MPTGDTSAEKYDHHESEEGSELALPRPSARLSRWLRPRLTIEQPVRLSASKAMCVTAGEKRSIESHDDRRDLQGGHQLSGEATDERIRNHQRMAPCELALRRRRSSKRGTPSSSTRKPSCAQLDGCLAVALTTAKCASKLLASPSQCIAYPRSSRARLLLPTSAPPRSSASRHTCVAFHAGLPEERLECTPRVRR